MHEPSRHETEHKSFEAPDETREFPQRHAEILNIGGGAVGRLVFQPGWRWSNDVKPIAQHRQLRGAALPVSRVRPARDPDGRRHRVRRRPRRLTSLPSGHDAWVVGDEPAVVVDWYGASNYAKSS